MAKKHYTEEEIIRILKEAENGMSVADLLRQYNISQGTFYHWKSAYSGMQVNELKVSVRQSTPYSESIIRDNVPGCYSKAAK